MADCCYKRSCPAPVSTVNVYVTEISLSDGNVDLFKQELLSLVLVSGTDYTAELSFLPYTDAALQVYINGVLQKRGIDYTREGKTLFFTFPADADANDMSVVANYVGTDYAVLESGIRSGVVMGWGGPGSPPAGWLVCDGTSLLRASYPSLFAAIGTTYGAVDGTHFNLPDLDLSYFSNGVVSVGPALIKI